MADKKLVILVTAVAAVAAVALIYYFMVLRKPQVQAVTVPQTTVVASPPPPPPPYSSIPVTSGSFLQPGTIMKVAAPPIPIGDSVWLPLQFLGSTNILVYEVMPALTAQMLGIGTTIVQGTLVKIVSAGTTLSTSYYATYGTQQTLLTPGLVRAIMVANGRIFKLLRLALGTNNQALLQSIQNSVVGNPTLSQLVNTIIQSGGMPAPFALKYSTAYALGIVPPVVTQQITNLNMAPTSVIIDFGVV